MKIAFDIGALRDTKWYEYAIRFALGGAITVAAGFIAKAYGPAVGGVFLAFPAIFPASATLLAAEVRRETHNENEVRKEVSQDAEGAALGSVALMGFAAFLWQTLPRYPFALCLPLGLFLWLCGAVLLWWAGGRLRPLFRRR